MILSLAFVMTLLPPLPAAAYVNKETRTLDFSIPDLSTLTTHYMVATVKPHHPRTTTHQYSLLEQVFQLTHGYARKYSSILQTQASDPVIHIPAKTLP